MDANAGISEFCIKVCGPHRYEATMKAKEQARPRRTGLKSRYVPVLQSVYLKVQDQGTVQSVFPNAINVLF